MKKVEIYTLDFCPYCTKAKELLDRKGISYEERKLDDNPEEGRTEMAKHTGGPRTVPQIFIGGNHIGGCDSLYELEEKGDLEALLKD